MTNTTIPDDWTGIPEEVEKIIASRRVTKERTSTNGDSVIHTTSTRPMRFIQFAREVDLTLQNAHRYIRQGKIPTEAAKNAIIAWVRIHRKGLSK